MISGRRGYTLAEVLVVLLVGLVLLHLGLGLVRATVQAVERLIRAGDATATLRTARHILGSEARWADGVLLIAADSMAARIFRGVAWPCDADRLEGDQLRVVATGLRRADPAKDSVLLVGPPGPPRVAALLEVAADTGSCPAGHPSERWRLSEELTPGVAALRYFERGSYHLSGGALRYRRGGGGRQPLTPEVLRTPPSGFRVGPPAQAELWAAEGNQPVRVLLGGS